MKILHAGSDLDITYSEQKLFCFAIHNDNYKMLSALIKYFETKQLPKFNFEDKSYYFHKICLKNQLENFIDGVNL